MTEPLGYGTVVRSMVHGTRMLIAPEDGSGHTWQAVMLKLPDDPRYRASLQHLPPGAMCHVVGPLEPEHDARWEVVDD